MNGRPLQLVIGDAEGDPAKGATIVKKFIYEDKVAAIVGPTRTGTGMAVKKLVEEAGMPTFMTVGGDPVIMGGEKFGAYTYVFKSPQRSSTAVKRLYAFLKEKGLKKVALLTAADGFGKDGVGWLQKLAPEFQSFGLDLTKFFIENVSLPEEVEQATQGFVAALHVADGVTGHERDPGKRAINAACPAWPG